MRNLVRLAKIAFQRILRNPYNTLAAVFVMFLAFFISGAFVLVTVGSNIILNYFESRPQVTAWLKDDTPSEQVKHIQDQLIKTGVVSKTKYVSKEEALKIFNKRYQNKPQLVEFVTADILPASIEVSTYKLEDLSKVASLLQKDNSIEEVDFQKDIVDKLSAWSSLVRNIGGGVVAFLLVTSFLITLIVIGLNISIHKDEIEIMKLVGATSAYVRTPFIFEGIFYGLFSAVLATILLWIVFAGSSPAIQSTFVGIPIISPSLSVFWYLLAGELLVGFAIGVVGSFFATRRYLNI